ncbi:hypothetical protein I5H06_gp13 [Mycobacterium phage SirPhilip]|uniref:Uncharacterized protein n=1 Tax=Mycobacterium phage SirPhilip TaxID=2015824 RepID=A0A222ZM85_9CAUD|nr:hypothetical protein I5H06_gp13 [Mycobacterium phage SirPhilip]ASR85291.1 hypothetical protein SEA_SIRPHILIP_89 [Mycobacterium phage SirPhilip]
MSVANINEKQRAYLNKMLTRFNEAMLWQLEHAEQEPERERLRRLFGS